MTTLRAASRIDAASSAVALRTVRRASSADAPCVCTWPNAPNSTLVNERFIALHMMIDRIRPDEPSSAPAMISSLLLSTNPMTPPTGRRRSSSSAMTVGMSAPPIGMISRTPNSSDRPAKIGKIQVCVRLNDQPDSERDRDPEQREVDEVLLGIRDRARGQHLLQLAERHQAAGERQEAEQHFENQRHHHAVAVRSCCAR